MTQEEIYAAMDRGTRRWLNAGTPHDTLALFEAEELGIEVEWPSGGQAPDKV